MKKAILGSLAVMVVCAGVLVADEVVKSTPAVRTANIETGAVIINGKYIEPPYTLEAKPNGIWINGILAEAITPKKERNHEARISGTRQAIQNEIYADYFELSEEMGQEKAEEALKENIVKKGKIRGVGIKNITINSPEYIEIQTDQGENVSVHISTSQQKMTQMLGEAIYRKYRVWDRASGQDENKAFNDLVNYLDNQKHKGWVKDYKFLHKSLDVKFKDKLVWNAFLTARGQPSPEDITTINNTSDAECDKMDAENLKRKVELYSQCLNQGSLQAFSSGGGSYIGASLGKRITSELKNIMIDKNMTLTEKKEKINKINHPAINEKQWQTIIGNINK